jgi:hypothetical protein
MNDCAARQSTCSNWDGWSTPNSWSLIDDRGAKEAAGIKDACADGGGGGSLSLNVREKKTQKLTDI